MSQQNTFTIPWQGWKCIHIPINRPNPNSGFTIIFWLTCSANSGNTGNSQTVSSEAIQGFSPLLVVKSYTLSVKSHIPPTSPFYSPYPVPPTLGISRPPPECRPMPSQRQAEYPRQAWNLWAIGVCASQRSDLAFCWPYAQMNDWQTDFPSATMHRTCLFLTGRNFVASWKPGKTLAT